MRPLGPGEPARPGDEVAMVVVDEAGDDEELVVIEAPFPAGTEPVPEGRWPSRANAFASRADRFANPGSAASESGSTFSATVRSRLFCRAR